MGFQVYRGGFWFRIHDGLASVFGVRRTPLGLWRVCFDVQPLIFPLYHFDSSWTGGCLYDSSFKNYPHEDDFGKAWDQYFFPEVKLAPDGSLIALDDEQVSLQRLKDELWRAYVEYIKPYFDRCVDEKSCLEAADQYGDSSYMYRDMYLIWHVKYNRCEEGLHRVKEIMTILWKNACVDPLPNMEKTLLRFYENNCDDEDEAKDIICCAYSQGKAASEFSYLEFDQIFEWWFCIYEKCKKLEEKYKIWYSEENEMFLANNDRLSKAFYKLFPGVKGEYTTQEKKEFIFLHRKSDVWIFLGKISEIFASIANEGFVLLQGAGAKVFH